MADKISSNARNVKECPFCREIISRTATRCPHCQENLFVPSKRRRRPFWMGNFMLGVYVATVFWLIMFYLYFR